MLSRSRWEEVKTQVQFHDQPSYVSMHMLILEAMLLWFHLLLNLFNVHNRSNVFDAWSRLCERCKKWLRDAVKTSQLCPFTLPTSFDSDVASFTKSSRVIDLDINESTLLSIPIMVGVSGSALEACLNGLPGEPCRFNFSKASISASENWRRCFGLNGFGVATLEVRNCSRLVSIRQ